MRFEDLSLEDQKLLQADFGEFDKLAADRVAVAEEMYATGFNKLAAETADALDKLAEEEKEEKNEKEEKEDDMDENTKKASADLGAFIEKGYFDGLVKLGSERHGNEMHYIIPFLAEKVAEAGAMKGAREALTKFWSKVKTVPGKAKEMGKKMHESHKAHMAGAKEGFGKKRIVTEQHGAKFFEDKRDIKE